MARVALALWVPGVSLVLVTQMIPHWVPLPAPSLAAQRPARALASLLDAQGRAGWQRVHVLYADCGCSQRVLEDLLERAHGAASSDFLLLVGEADDQAARARAAGLPHARVTPAALEARFGLVAAPLLLVLDPERRLVYSGGHTDRKRGLDLRYEAISDRLEAGESVESLPAFGCAVSRELQQRLDPLGLKY